MKPKLKWTKVGDSWLCSNAQDFEGWVGRTDDRLFWWTFNYARRYQNGGGCYGGGGSFCSADEAKRGLVRAYQ